MSDVLAAHSSNPSDGFSSLSGNNGVGATAANGNSRNQNAIELPGDAGRPAAPVWPPPSSSTRAIRQKYLELKAPQAILGMEIF